MERVVNSMDNGPFSFKSMLNVLTKKRFLFTSNLSDAVAYFGVYKDHPLLSIRSSSKTFRVSLFNCPPYVIYLPGNNLFDGLEFRILSEITHPWTIQPTKCDISQTISDPWSTVLKNVNNGTTDLAMCSVWLNLKSNDFYDATNYIDYQCGTFLVPKPTLVNPAAYLYMSLSRNVWMAFLFSFISTSIIMTLTARTGKRFLKKSWNDKLYIDFSRSFLDSMNVATLHGIEKFPKQDSIKSLFTSWIILSLIMGVAYTTGYTSFLTRPISTKPVDSLVDFLQNGMYWSVVSGPNSLAPTLKATGVTNLVRLSQRTIDKNNATMDDSSNERNALFVKIITNRFITDVNENTDPTYSLRIMKSCFLNYYSVVAFKKYSGYTKYFNEKIRAYAEFGLTERWALNIKGVKNNYMKPYFLSDGKSTDGPIRLSVTTLTGAFTLLWVGLVLATVVFMTERLLRAFYSNRKLLKRN
ncbi:uncharacterized protein LOC119085982 [Bradysia coprophila]|uniref:uncharacterized protein LOC119085982 n=1 Tax=Bradysia coprophila TaxID=38358 RepID=UPI00187DC1DB|nr:uncharacterized protein LOC119085982 [Bradysia coprophila]